MPVRDILRFCVVLHIISSFHKCAECALVIKPQDVVAVSGEIVIMDCSSSASKRGNILWSVTDPGNYIYGHNETSPKVKSYISVSERDDGSCSLTINASLAAANKYICRDLDSEDQASAELIVMENLGKCTREIKDSSLHISCFVVSAGNWAPTVACEQENEGNQSSLLQANGPLKLDTISNVVTRTWNFTSKKDSCNTKIACLTEFKHSGRSRQTIATYCTPCSFDKIGVLPNIDDSALWALPNYDGCFSKSFIDSLERINRDYAKELSTFSIICYVVSVSALLLTVFSYIFNWKKSGSVQAAFLVSLCVALMCVYSLCAVALAIKSDFKDGCRGIVLSLQYFILVAFCIMLAENVKLLLYIIFDFQVGRTSHTIGLFVGAWGLPIIIVLASLSSKVVRGDDYGLVCLLGLDHSFIWAIAAPVLCFFVANFIISISVLVHLYWNISRLPKIAKRRNQIRATLSDMVVIYPVLFLGWFFAALSSAYGSVLYLHLFIFISSLQGLLIFILHVLCNRKMKDIFTCVDFNLNICSGDVTQESLPKKPVEELPKENV